MDAEQGDDVPVIQLAGSRFGSNGGDYVTGCEQTTWGVC